MKTFIVDVSLVVSVNPSTEGENSIFCANEFKLFDAHLKAPWWLEFKFCVIITRKNLNSSAQKNM